MGVYPYTSNDACVILILLFRIHLLLPVIILINLLLVITDAIKSDAKNRSQIKQAEGKAEAEKISPINGAEGKAEAET